MSSAAATVAHVKHRNVALDCIDDGQDPQFLACRKLVMNEVHRPNIVRPDRFGTVVTQLRLHPPLGCSVPELNAQLTQNSIDFLDVHAPAFAVEQDIDTPIALADARLTYLLVPLGNGSLIGAAGLVVERRAVEPDDPTIRPDRHRPIAAHPINQFAHATGPQIFRRIKSGSTSRSKVRSRAPVVAG